MKVSPQVAQLPWMHHLILDQARRTEERKVYMLKVIHSELEGGA